MDCKSIQLSDVCVVGDAGGLCVYVMVSRERSEQHLIIFRPAHSTDTSDE